MSLLDFLTQQFNVPRDARAWVLAHVSPDQALARAPMVHLDWIARCCTHNAQEIARVLSALIKARLAHRDGGSHAPLARNELRETIRSTSWWQCLCLDWERWYTHGCESRSYVVHLASGKTATVRGTAVGRHAVREVLASEFWPVPPRSLPSRRHLEALPAIYIVDHIDLGLSLGCFASPAVAFWLADRFDRNQDEATTRKVWRAAVHHRGTSINGRWRSWPAPPPPFARHT
jgi:hypothetical protein